ncbi:amidohydrolase [Pseudoroseicyclus sp. CXY001]|uniref:amidohydrolase family protein n=1 Tax=Pseudoroseicyclus sp. CXY001 TaxID=3242492 RepID=UPI00358DD19F
MTRPDIETAPLVDTHAHIFREGMPFTGGAWNRPDYPFTAETFLKMLDAHGVHFGVIAGISLFGTYNDYMIEALRQQPRLRGTASVTPQVSPFDLARMHECGVVGIRLFRIAHVFGEPPDIRTDDYRQLFHRVRDLGWHVHFLAGPGDYEETLEVLGEVGVDTVIDHYGRCDPALGLDCPKLSGALRAIEKGHTWLKVSAGWRFAGKTKDGSRPDFERAIDDEIKVMELIRAEVGLDRLLWGSDAPFIGQEAHMSYELALKGYMAAVPDPADRRRIDRNALELYFA